MFGQRLLRRDRSDKLNKVREMTRRAAQRQRPRPRRSLATSGPCAWPRWRSGPGRHSTKPRSTTPSQTNTGVGYVPTRARSQERCALISKPSPGFLVRRSWRLATAVVYEGGHRAPGWPRAGMDRGQAGVDAVDRPGRRGRHQGGSGRLPAIAPQVAMSPAVIATAGSLFSPCSRPIVRRWTSAT